MKSPRVIALAAITALAAAPVVASNATTASAAPSTVAKSGPVNVAYVEVNSDQLSNVGRYTVADGSNTFDLAIIFAANINWNGTKAVLYNNPNVQATLDAAATQIRPLQAKGIKVSLSILGNHQGAGIANFQTEAAAQDFASQVTATVTKYGLDGVDLDDEYADYGANGLPGPNPPSAGWLVTALRAQMPDKVISFYNIGPAASQLANSSSTIGAKINYAWNPYYGTYSAPSIPGIPKSGLSAAAVDIRNTAQSTAASLAQRTVADGFGVFMTYNLPGTDKSSYLSAITQPLYGQSTTFR